MALQVTNSCLKVFEAISKVAEAEGTPERRKQEVEYVYIIGLWLPFTPQSTSLQHTDTGHRCTQ